MKRSLVGYGVFALISILSIILMVAMVLIYCKIARQKIKQVMTLVRCALIIFACLIASMAVTAFLLTVPTFNQIPIYFVHTSVFSIFNILPPLVFLLNLKCQALVSAGKSHSKYTPLLDTLNALAPESDRLSVNSNTVALSLQYTGEFTRMEPSAA